MRKRYIAADREVVEYDSLDDLVEELLERIIKRLIDDLELEGSFDVNSGKVIIQFKVKKK